MRRSLLVLVAVTLAVSACSPAASTTRPSPSITPAASPSPDTTPAPGTTGSPVASPDATSARPSSALASEAPASALVPPQVTAGPAPTGTFVLGDSIILGSGVGPRLAQFGYTVVGVVGQSATETYLRTHLSSLAAQSARTWVIELGTNNPGDPADVARLDRLVQVVDELRTDGAAQKVYWVTPYRPPSSGVLLGANALDGYIIELARLAAQNRWLRLVDWAGTARLHPEWFSQDGMRLHPDAVGQAVLLALIAGPDATPVSTPSPLLTPGPASQVPEPETFSNSTLRPTPRSTPTPTPSPVATPPEAEPAPLDLASEAANVQTPAPIPSPTQPPP